MPPSIPSGSRPAAAPRAGLAIGSTGFTVMIIVLLVAIVFAANANDVIGWLVVAIAAGWLVFAVIVFLQLRAGVRSAAATVDRTVWSPYSRDINERSKYSSSSRFGLRNIESKTLRYIRRNWWGMVPRMRQ